MADSTSSVLRATWSSPAKVNLCLRIVGRRDDGYHLLDSVFAAVDLCDRITVEVRDVLAGTRPVVEMRCDHTDVPASSSNLAARAATAVLAERGLGAHVTITLEKRIPPGSGLGGGSGNAATVLRGLNALLALGVSDARLHALALRLGADVAFFLYGGLARVRGIGEHVEPLPPPDDLHVVLAIPPFGVSTAWAFGAYAAAGIAFSPEHAAVCVGARPETADLVNDLEAVVLGRYPQLAAIKRQMLAAGAETAVMSGSGSTIVGLAATAAAARAIAAAVAAADGTLAVHVGGLYDPASERAARAPG
jgi:4-diphosphocytidyl-2-C-methyl-D-erythritol kinase